MMRSFLNKLKDKRVLLTLLSVSLALNIFMMAILGGAMLGKRFPFLIFARSQINEVIGNLSDARQKEIRGIIRRQIFPELRQRFAAQEKLRLELSHKIVEPDISREALEKEFSEIRTLTSQGQEQMQDHFIDIILMLSPQERATLAKGIRNILQ